MSNLFRKVFLSRKGLGWLVNIIMQVILTYKLAYQSDTTPEHIANYIFWIIMVNVAVQLVNVGLISFEKIKVQAQIGK